MAWATELTGGAAAAVGEHPALVGEQVDSFLELGDHRILQDIRTGGLLQFGGLRCAEDVVHDGDVAEDADQLEVGVGAQEEEFAAELLLDGVVGELDVLQVGEHVVDIVDRAVPAGPDAPDIAHRCIETVVADFGSFAGGVRGGIGEQVVGAGLREVDILIAFVAHYLGIGSADTLFDMGRRGEVPFAGQGPYRGDDEFAIITGNAEKSKSGNECCIFENIFHGFSHF